MECWIKPTEVANASHGDGLFSKGFSSDNNSGVYELLLVPTNNISYPYYRMRIGGTTILHNPTSIPINVNQVSHLVVTYDGSFMRAYVNGVQSGTGSAVTGTIEANTQQLTIGVRYQQRTGIADSFYSGHMYSARIYNRALNQFEIQQNYNAMYSRFNTDSNSLQKIVTNGLVLYANATDLRSYTSGSTTWFDLSGNNNNGTLTNGAVFSASNGGSILLDGVNDYVNFGDSASLGFTTNASVNVWFRVIRYNGGFQGIVSKRSLAGITNYAISLNDSINIIFSSYSSDGTNFRSLTASLSSNITLGNWHNVCATFEQNGSNTNSTLYVNGNRIASGTFAGNLPTVVAPLLAGSSTTSQEPLSGSISNVLVYNRTLQPFEVLQNYNAQKSLYGL
jgi:L-rhamnose mutarotase